MPPYLPPETISAPVLVIGAGPVGLFAAFMCGMHRLRCAILDALPYAGGQCQALYPEKPIYDIPAFPKITGQDLVANLLTQLQPLSPHWMLGEQAQAVQAHPQGGWYVHTSRTTLYAKAIIICAGMGAFIPKKPDISELPLIEAASVRYCVQNPQEFQGKNIVILGGGDSALDWAINLAPVCNHIHVVHRRNTFRAQVCLLDSVKKLESAGKITLHTPFRLHGVTHDNGVLSAVSLCNIDSQEVRFLESHMLLPFLGMDSDLGPLAHWNLACHQRQIIIDPTTGQTNREGIYAAGDVAYYPHKRKLIVTGFAEAAQIAYHLPTYLSPQAHHSFTHSTTSGVPTL